jgi:hypothetical protein
MKIYQEGFLPVLSKVIGVVLFTALIVSGLNEIVVLWDNFLINYDPNHLPFDLMQLIFYVILIIGFPFILLVLIFGLFPTIRVVTSGIEYRRLFIFRKIKWDAIEFITEVNWPTNCHALVFHPKPDSFFDWWIGGLHSIIAGRGVTSGFFTSVLIMSISSENKDKLSRLIKEKHSPTLVPPIENI